jgi:hypothetical protein
MAHEARLRYGFLTVTQTGASNPNVMREKETAKMGWRNYPFESRHFSVRRSDSLLRATGHAGLSESMIQNESENESGPSVISRRHHSFATSNYTAPDSSNVE